MDFLTVKYNPIDEWKGKLDLPEMVEHEDASQWRQNSKKEVEIGDVLVNEEQYFMNMYRRINLLLSIEHLHRAQSEGARKSRDRQDALQEGHWTHADVIGNKSSPWTKPRRSSIILG